MGQSICIAEHISTTYDCTDTCHSNCRPFSHCLLYDCISLSFSPTFSSLRLYVLFADYRIARNFPYFATFLFLSECAVTGCSNCDSDVSKCDTCEEGRLSDEKSACITGNDGGSENDDDNGLSIGAIIGESK